VPFHVFDEQYAVSGAQPVEAFTRTLDAATGREV
jgi:predicted DsbA family dithiol-disulfide isomerase